MTDYMKEAERLAQAYADAVLLGDGNDEALAALLAHIQRGVPDGFLEQLSELRVPNCVRDRWNIESDTTHGRILVCRNEHDKSAGCTMTEMPPVEVVRVIRDMWSYINSVQALLAAPDHFRDAAEMAATPAEVPMPEPIGFIDSDDDETWAKLTQNAHELATLKLLSAVFHVSQMRTYGDAREAAGYALGLKEAGRLISLWLKDPDVQRMLEFARDASRKVTSWPDRLTGEAEAER